MTKNRYIGLGLVLALTLAGMTGCNENSSSEQEEADEDKASIQFLEDNVKAEGKGITVDGTTVTITQGGDYEVKGECNNARIYIEAGKKDEVNIILNGATLSNDNESVIYEKKAKNVSVIMTQGTKNTINSSYEDDKATVYAKDSLILKGEGELEITSKGDAIVSKENITVEEGIYTITTGDGAKTTQQDKGDLSQLPDDMKEEFEQGKRPQLPDDKKEEFEQGKRPQLPDGREQFLKDDASQETNGETSQKGFKCDNTLTIDGGTFNMNTEDDSFNSEDICIINNGELTIATGDDAIHADKELTINGGNINVVNSKEGIEATQININDGNIKVVASDDGFNACGGNSIFGNKKSKSENSESDVEPVININGADIYINSNGDGIDSNGSLYINGGTIYVDGPASGGNSAIDVASENKGIAVITGGTVTAIGYANMAEKFDESSTQQSIFHKFDEKIPADSVISITDSTGKEIAAIKTVKKCDCIIYSSSELIENEQYNVELKDDEN